MNDIEFIVYFNDCFFTHLYGDSFYNDRPEPNRMHAQSLWNIYQTMKAGGNSIAITDKDKNIVFETSHLLELREWIGRKYPQFVYILDAQTTSNHPGDRLKRPS